MSSLSGKVAIVTGAAHGIGAASASALAEAGARVTLLDLDGDAVAAQAKTIPSALSFRTDVTDKGAVEKTFAAVTEAFGGVDIVVNNAGVESVWTVERMPEADWDRVFAVNLKGAMLCTQAAVPTMRARGGGSVVNIASIAGKRISYSGGASYTASKSGLLGFTRHAAFELAMDKIRVNAVCPGPTLTPMIERNADAAQRRRIEGIIPMGRWIMPRDIANAVVFLAGDGAAMCTGTSIDVDGGVMVSNGTRYEDYFARRR